MAFLCRYSAIVLLLLFLPFPSTSQTLNMEKLQGMKARSIGPAGMSGRVTSIDVVLKNPQIIYVGTASGGVWKSTSGGVAWEPIFDTLAVASVGAVAVDQRTPDIVWVGTGEGNPRNSQTSGNGVYKSMDGGKSWRHLGLENTRHIHRVIIHPYDPDIVYVGAQGAAYGENPERGVFRTTNGGASWERILFVNEKTGVADLVMDPSNPNKLIAALWEYRRWPWHFTSGGPGSGLYITIDAGKQWRKVTSEDGLPSGDLGRIGLAIAPSNPDILYALVEAKKNALYGSTDGGVTWKKISDENIGNRPFYYADIYVDPKNENRIYNLYSLVSISEDGGKTFEVLLPFHRVHPDYHAWWIHPDDPSFLIAGNDGGLAISHDRGKTWRFVENLPLAQFYHINVDMEHLYHVYGGMQDNGSWRGPGRVLRMGGIRNAYWEEVAFGDGFDVVPDQSNARFGYAMSQGGYLVRYDLITGEQKLVRPAHPDDVPLRFNWNAGIAHDPFNQTTIYYGSQFLHKSTNRGDSWSIISPDLSTNDTSKQRQLESGGLTYDMTAAENHTSIITVAPSPLQQGVIWVGTDDGNVQLTTDGGMTWTNVVSNIKGVPKNTWVPQIQPSTYNAAEAYVVFDNHRNNDWTPYIFRTTTFGRTWTRFVDERSVSGYALSIVQDRVEPKLFFVGTEFGLYVTIDGGRTWTKWTQGYPTVSTMDMIIHPREDDLVIGTFGRAAYIIDDIRPLRGLAKAGATLLEKQLHVFPIANAEQVSYRQAAGSRFVAEAEFSGENRAYGALISFVFNPEPDTAGEKQVTSKHSKKDTVTVEVLDAKSEIIRTLQVSASPGLNRTTWNLDRKGVRFPTSSRAGSRSQEPGGPDVVPGTYAVRLRYKNHRDSTTVIVKGDPRTEIVESTLVENAALYQKLLHAIELATKGVDRLNDAKKTISAIQERIKEMEGDTLKQIREKGTALQDSLKTLIGLITPREVQGIRSDPRLVSSRLGLARWYLGSSRTSSGKTERTVLEQAEKALENAISRIDMFFEREWGPYRRSVETANVSFFDSYTPLSPAEKK